MTEAEQEIVRLNERIGQRNREAGSGPSSGSEARMTRVQIEKAIAAASQDEPFTMPFFLASCLVAELRRQKLNRVAYTGDDFSVTVKIKKAKPPNSDYATGIS